MNAHRWLIFIAAGLTIGAGFWLRARERELDAYEQTVVARLAANHRMAVAARTTPPANRARAEGAPAPRSSSGADAATDPDVKSVWISRMLSQLPEYKAWQRGNWQVAVMREYGEWLGTLNVTAERLQQIKAALLNYITLRQELYNALTASGLAPTSKAFGERAKVNDETVSSQLRQALSVDEFASFERYSQTQGWVRRLPEMNMYLAERGVEPLSSAQRATLIEVVAEARAWTPPAGLPNGKAEQLRTARISELARQRLDGPQRDALVAYFGFANERSKIAAQLYDPRHPDATYPWSSPAF